MEFRLIDKTFYNELAPLSYGLATSHAQMRPDLFPEIEIMTKKEFKKRIGMKGFIGIVAYENSTLCSYCFCRIKSFKSKLKADSKTLWIDEFYVCKEFRRSGYGTKLFREIEKVAKEKSCSAIEFTVWDFNETAQKFYDSLGCRNQNITKEYIL